MVDELATIYIVEVFNGFVVTQRKKKRKVKWENQLGLLKMLGCKIFMVRAYLCKIWENENSPW
jgi:hypothetical protein